MTDAVGALRRVIENARREMRCSRNRLTVLSTQVDPYRLDTPAGHRDGAWLAEQLRVARSAWSGVFTGGGCTMRSSQLVISGNQTATSIATMTPTGHGSLTMPARLPGGWAMWASSGSLITGTQNHSFIVGRGLRRRHGHRPGSTSQFPISMISSLPRVCRAS